MTDDDTPLVTNGERALRYHFETYARTANLDVRRTFAGRYLDKSTRTAWYAFLHAHNLACETCALACEAERDNHHSEANLELRTEFGKEIAKAQGYGAANCATQCRRLTV